jgi:thiol-disulfide isomerase/thioredoxin
MDSLTLVARLVLSVVFCVAALAKLANRTGFRQMLTNFGVPGGLASSLAVVLPFAEIAVAAALLPLASVWFGAMGALFLLLVFIAGISFNLARGRTPECNCFGQLHSAPIGRPTLARNLVLAALAGFIVLQGKETSGLSIVGWLTALTVVQRVAFFSGLAGLTLLSGQTLLLLQVLRQQGRLLLRVDSLEHFAQTGAAPVAASLPSQPVAGLPVGTPAPAFELNSLRGETLGLDALLAVGKPLLLLFTNPNCGPCLALLPEVVDWQREHKSVLTVGLITEGRAEDNRAKSAVLDDQLQLLLQQNREVAEAYQAYGTPAAVLIRQDGTIGSAVAQGADEIRTLVSETLSGARSAARSTLATAKGRNRMGDPRSSSVSPARIGELAPSLRFQDLDGQSVSLANFQGRKTLLLFWNPSCGYCQQMLDDIKAWELDQPSDPPTLVVISIGTTEENRAMSLRSLVLLDQGFQAAAAFGAHGTPMGVIIDSTGRIASEIAAGAQAVFALANTPTREAIQLVG